jgi:predicted DNA-binding transcriptional regulator YafY
MIGEKRQNVASIFGLIDDGPATNVARDKDAMIAAAVRQQHAPKSEKADAPLAELIDDGRTRSKASSRHRGERHSETFRLFQRAILDRKQVVFTYRGAPREVCPYILGHKRGAEQVLTFQFAGENERRLRVRGQWKCFQVSEIRIAEMRDGPWHGDSEHRNTQRCVDEVFIDVNTDVPNQPGRR